MPYNFVANNFYAKQLCSRLSSPKTAVLRVSFLWGLRVTYTMIILGSLESALERIFPLVLIGVN